MSLYADTSLLVSYYVNDANSARAQALIHAVIDPLIFSGLHRLELRNALQLGVFRQLLTPAQSQAAWINVEKDIRADRLFPQPVNWVPVFRTAAQLAMRHSAGIGCRSLTLTKHISDGMFILGMVFIHSVTGFDCKRRMDQVGGDRFARGQKHNLRQERKILWIL